MASVFISYDGLRDIYLLFPVTYIIARVLYYIKNFSLSFNMKISSTSHWTLAVLPLFLLSVSAWFLCWWLKAAMPDDAYIYLDFARNLAEQSRWAFNASGPTVNSATSPLFTLLVASLVKLGLPGASPLLAASNPVMRPGA